MMQRSARSIHPASGPIAARVGSSETDRQRRLGRRLFARRASLRLFLDGDLVARLPVDDVATVDLGTVREAPGARTKDGALLGIVHRGDDLIAVLDAQTLVATHSAATAVLDETAEETV